MAIMDINLGEVQDGSVLEFKNVFVRIEDI